jgi:hypothetical protein
VRTIDVDLGSPCKPLHHSSLSIEQLVREMRRYPTTNPKISFVTLQDYHTCGACGKDRYYLNLRIETFSLNNVLQLLRV